jgi:apolipoprotein D and lipocalin family protein
MKNRCLALGLVGCLTLGCGALAQGSPEAAIEPIAALELSRYLGNWYQVALIPNRFQSQCVSDTTASYRQRSDGAIEVINRCRDARGTFDEAIGFARPTGTLSGGMLQPARLEVSFLPPWLRWAQSIGHWGWGAYWVIQLAPDYRYAVIGEGTREYLWVLSRTPSLSAEDEAMIRARLQEQGYDIARIQSHPHGKASQQQ